MVPHCANWLCAHQGMTGCVPQHSAPQLHVAPLAPGEYDYPSQQQYLSDLQTKCACANHLECKAALAGGIALVHSCHRSNRNLSGTYDTSYEDNHRSSQSSQNNVDIL